jgi:hypothetical protein
MLGGQTPALRVLLGALGLLEQLGLAGCLDEAGGAAEVGRRTSLGKAERLGPQALMAEEALNVLGVADQRASCVLRSEDRCRPASPRSGASVRPTASTGGALRCGLAWLAASCAPAGGGVSVVTGSGNGGMTSGRQGLAAASTPLAWGTTPLPRPSHAPYDTPRGHAQTGLLRPQSHIAARFPPPQRKFRPSKGSKSVPHRQEAACSDCKSVSRRFAVDISARTRASQRPGGLRVPPPSDFPPSGMPTWRLHLRIPLSGNGFEVIATAAPAVGKRN